MFFGSDNQTGASDKVLANIATANNGHTHGYGDDDWTKRAHRLINETFECDARVFFVASGTAANSLALSCLVRPWETILSHHEAHVIIDESTAPEFFTGGARQISITNTAGKIDAKHLQRFLNQAGTDVPHNAKPAAVTLAQVNELGLVYQPDDLSRLKEVSQQHKLSIHMDGARFANAVSATQISPAKLTWQSGIDVLSLGATKCGCLAAEAVVFFDHALAEDFEHRRKRSGHLLSKGRLLASQFIAWLEDDHWLKLAAHANSQATRLAGALEKNPEIRLAWPCEANEIFAIMPKHTEQRLKKSGAEFYRWYSHGLPAHESLNDTEVLVRLVTSFNTQAEEVNEFIEVAAPR